MLKQLNDRLRLMRATRDRCEELSQTMEFLDAGAIRPLKSHLRRYNDDSEKEQLRLNVEAEVSRLVDIADARRTKEAAGSTEPEEVKQAELADSGSKHGYLGWLSRHTNMSDEENSDIWREKELPEDELYEGLIVDAQDYLGEWHLAIVCKHEPEQDDEFARLNFLRYPKGNRDEWYSRAEVKDRMAGPFSKVEGMPQDESAIGKLANLREYYGKVRTSAPRKSAESRKAGKKQELKTPVGGK